MTPLHGPDKRTYALAQGPLSVGGYRYDANGNSKQKNHPTSGVVPLGATVEIPVRADLVADDDYLRFVLTSADAGTSQRIEQRINQLLGPGSAHSLDAKTVRVRAPLDSGALNDYVARIEAMAVEPDQVSRVVINERTGTVVAGGDTKISPITISHGDIKVSVSTQYSASQPNLVSFTGPGVRSLIVGNTDMSVDESSQSVAATFAAGTVGDLVRALSKVRVSTRDVISILQAIKAAGALHAELIIQ
jgi:flagellar P-ring protein FlgI